MRVESKTRASIFEAIVLKAWALCDELLPELRRAAGLRSAAVAEARALRAELATAEAQRLRSEQHAEQVERGAAAQRSSRVAAEGAHKTAQAAIALLPSYLPRRSRPRRSRYSLVT